MKITGNGMKITKNSMKRFLTVTSFGLSLLALAQTAECSSLVTGIQVVKYGTYGNGNLYITLNKTIDQAGCPGPYLEILANSPAYNQIVALTSISFATSANLEIQTDTCNNGTASFSGARNNTGFALAKP